MTTKLVSQGRKDEREEQGTDYRKLHEYDY